MKNKKNMFYFKKKRCLEVINFGFSKPDKEKLISSKKKLLLILKILLTRRKILFNALVSLIDQFVHAARKRSRRRLVGNQGWRDTVVNNYSVEQFKCDFPFKSK